MLHRYGILFLFGLITIMISSAQAEEDKKTSAPKIFGYAQYTKYEAPRYRAAAYGAFLSYRFSKQFQPSIAFNDSTREYNGNGDQLHETNYTLGVVSVVRHDIYIEADANTSPDAKIGAKESYNITPHWVHGSTDFGLRFGYSRYIDSKAGLLVPSVNHDFSDQFSIYGAFYIARTHKEIFAEQLKISYSPWSRHRFTIGGAAGRTIEDAGVDAEFKSVGIEYNYHFNYFTLGLAHNRYWSTLRSEHSYTLSLGFK